MTMPAGQDAGNAPVQVQAPVSMPSGQPSRLDQLMNSSSTIIGFGSSKPAAASLAANGSKPQATGLSQKTQIPNISSSATNAQLTPSTNISSTTPMAGQELREKPA